jgi:hypothetical protein
LASRLQFRIILVAMSFLAVFSPALAQGRPQWGTLDAADLSCSGRPEVECQSSLYRGACNGEGAPLRNTTLLLRSRPAGAQIRLARRQTSSTDQIPLDVRPLWVHSGAWDQDGVLLLADVMRGKLLRYSRTGNLMGIVGTDEEVALRHPTALQPVSSGNLVRDGGGRFVLLDRKHTKVREWDLFVTGRQGTLRSIFQWSLIGESMLAFGDVLQADGAWKSAFVRIPLGTPEKFEILNLQAPSDPNRGFYLLGNPFLATLGDTGYVLMLDKPFVIYEVPSREALDRLKRVPLSLLDRFPAFAPSPIPGAADARALPVRYAALEKLYVPAGLYARGEHLYLLVRRPLKGTGTQWLLTRIDPRRGKILGSVVLPTSANHLTLVPGADVWAFIEKGAVLGPGKQEIPSIRLLPSDWVEGRTPSLPNHIGVSPATPRARSGFVPFTLKLIHRGFLSAVTVSHFLRQRHSL